MRNFRKYGLALLLLAATGEICACSCAVDSTEIDKDRVKRLFESSDLVGVFEVVDRTRTAIFNGKKLKGRFAVLESRHVFKGIVFGGQKIYAALKGTNTSCEVNYEEGELLLVYSFGAEPVEIGFCGASGSLAGGLRDVRYLFEITEPEIFGK